MSDQTIPLLNSNSAIINTDVSKTFIWNPRSEDADFTDSGSGITLKVGTVMGRISASGKILVLKSAAVDGSEIPVGILMQEVVVAASATVNLTFAVSGDVAEEKLIFDGSDDLDTVVDGRQLRDRIAADTVGIKLVKGTELTGFDNS